MRLTPKVRKAMKRAVEVEGADTSFAELVQRDAYTQAPIDAEAVPTDTELPSDGYDRTEPGPVGAAHTALVMHMDEHGIAKLSLVKKDGTPDVKRTELLRMYSKRKKDWAEFSAQQAKRINNKD